MNPPITWRALSDRLADFEKANPKSRREKQQREIAAMVQQEVQGQIAAQLVLRDEAGVGPDEHVAVLMENRIECVELILGAILAGVWITPINWHLAPDEIDYVVADSGAKVLFTGPAFAEVAREIGARHGASVLEAGAPLVRRAHLEA